MCDSENMTARASPSQVTHFCVCLSTFRDSCENYNEELCDRKWPSVTQSVPGGRAQNQNIQAKPSQKMTKLESTGLFLTHQAPSCQDVKAKQWQRSPSL